MLSESSILCNNSNHPILECLSIRRGVRILKDHWRGRWVLLWGSRSCGFDNSIKLILQDLEELLRVVLPLGYLLSSSLIATRYYALVSKVCIAKLEGLTDGINLVSKFANVKIVWSQLQDLLAQLKCKLPQLLSAHWLNVFFAWQVLIDVCVHTSNIFVLNLSQVLF